MSQPTFKEYLTEIESELYTALEALEQEDLITVRQCSARAQAKTNEAWRERRKDAERKET